MTSDKKKKGKNDKKEEADHIRVSVQPTTSGIQAKQIYYKTKQKWKQ